MPDDEAKGRVTIVTGATSGIGLHLAEVLVRAGDRVVVTERGDGGRLEALTASWPRERVRIERLDVRDGAAWDAVIARTVEAWGRIDVLLNVAGVLRPGFVHELPAEDVDFHVDANVKGTLHGTRAAAAQMVRQGSGHVVNIASLAAIAPTPGLSLYSATKFAVRGFSLAAAQELRPHGVFVTVVCPGAVQTPMLDVQVGRDEAAWTFSGGPPLTVEDVGRVVVDRVLRDRPLEVTLPATRGWMAKLGALVPEVAWWVGPRLTKEGRAAQDRRRRGQ